jgi:hypothetical protein
MLTMFAADQMRVLYGPTERCVPAFQASSRFPIRTRRLRARLFSAGASRLWMMRFLEISAALFSANAVAGTEVPLFAGGALRLRSLQSGKTSAARFTAVDGARRERHAGRCRLRRGLDRSFRMQIVRPLEDYTARPEGL